MNSYKTIALGLVFTAFSSAAFSAAAITNAFDQVGGAINNAASQVSGAYLGAANQAAGAITSAFNPTAGTIASNPQQQMEVLSNNLFQTEMHFFRTACSNDNVQNLEFLINIMTPRFTFTQMFMEFEKTNAHKSMILLLQQNLVPVHEYPPALAWAALLDASTFHRIMHFEKISPKELTAALTFAQQNFVGKMNEAQSQAAIALLQASKNAVLVQTAAAIPTPATAVQPA